MTLQDSHGRRFSYLRLSVTDVCNFRCNYCLPDGYECSDDTASLTVEEITHLARAFAAQGTRKIRITGGEPSLRRDLPQIIEAVANTPGIEQVAITTNGYKLTKHLPAWHAAGLTQLNVSIDSLDPRQFKAITGHDRLQELLDGIALAQTLGFKNIKVNAVLLRDYNLAEFDHFLDWIKTTPITLRFIELMQTGDNQDYFAANHVSGESIKQRLEANGWQPVLRRAHAGPAQEFCHPEYEGRIGLIMPYSKDFCSTCNRLRISSLGKLHLCLFGEHGYDLRPLMTVDKEAELELALQELLQKKTATHFLHDGETGAIQHFAMIGG
ncbi:GTP 3',8-cyclase MoaA [Thalassolituus oleivorans]|jgi:cyclic pyranopterin phosphate synthase|uniref:GTP 3',8-cyclase MoaA n=1 Tax=Thalassolituus oleivorans TaxID=187493 RepID=UPI0023F002BB|nr:GTP 3',8-cyclase MoaA [Thalassolituus oleivorans]|tara:strand:+ start:16055 stop:17029 length:975 start_codon:yes stop_codon:yes gene_type:complete